MTTGKYRTYLNAWHSAATPIALSLAMFVTLGPGAAYAQETTATTTAEAAATTAPAEKLNLADEESTQAVVLLGEKVGLDAPGKPPYPDLQALAQNALGGIIVDYTKPGITIAETAEMVRSADKTKTDVAVVFLGFTDGKEDVSDDDQRTAIDELLKALQRNNPAMRIFLVPAATTVGTLTNANMRLASDGEKITFVPLGTEVGGQPYHDALVAVSAELETPVDTTAVVEESPEPAPANAVTVSGGKLGAPTEEAETAQSFEEKKADLQEELSRIAGQSGQASQTLPPISGTTDTTTFLPDDGTTYPEGGTLTKRGPEAQESINMRPLPAVKAFRPQVPVPRNQIDKKEPALSR